MKKRGGEKNREKTTWKKEENRKDGFKHEKNEG